MQFIIHFSKEKLWYDALNRVVSEEEPNGAITPYEYDVVGNLTAITDVFGNRTTYEYDASGNLTTITDP